MTTPPSAIPSSQPPPPPPEAQRPRNGMAVAALVLGVAALVAVASFVLFPLGFVAAIVGLILGLIAVTRGGDRGATNQGQAVAGIVCCALALIGAVALTVRVGTWAARNTGAITRFDKCIAQSNSQNDVANCIAGFARDVRP